MIVTCNANVVANRQKTNLLSDSSIYLGISAAQPLFLEDIFDGEKGYDAEFSSLFYPISNFGMRLSMGASQANFTLYRYHTKKIRVSGLYYKVGFFALQVLNDKKDAVLGGVTLILSDYTEYAKIIYADNVWNQTRTVYNTNKGYATGLGLDLMYIKNLKHNFAMFMLFELTSITRNGVYDMYYPGMSGFNISPFSYRSYFRLQLGIMYDLNYSLIKSTFRSN